MRPPGSRSRCRAERPSTNRKRTAIGSRAPDAVCVARRRRARGRRTEGEGRSLVREGCDHGRRFRRSVTARRPAPCMRTGAGSRPTPVGFAADGMAWKSMGRAQGAAAEASRAITACRARLPRQGATGRLSKAIMTGAATTKRSASAMNAVSKAMTVDWPVTALPSKAVAVWPGRRDRAPRSYQ